MKIIFFGSSGFSIPCLELLASKYEVVLAITQPDRQKGRSLEVSPTPIKTLAAGLGIKIFQPEDINSPSSVKYLKEFNAELFIVVSFGQILKKELLDIPRQYSLNIHASLLPKYRGASPINWAIANGEKDSGVTIIKMNEKMDEGDVVAKESVSIDPLDDAVTLAHKLSKKGAKLIADVIEKVKAGSVVMEKQDSSKATYAPKLKKENGIIDWSLKALHIHNRIRAFTPWPGCFTHLDRKVVKVWKSRVRPDSNYAGLMPGTIVELGKSFIAVIAGENTVLEIEELQLEGSRRMIANDFVIGHRDIAPGTTFY